MRGKKPLIFFSSLGLSFSAPVTTLPFSKYNDLHFFNIKITNRLMFNYLVMDGSDQDYFASEC